MMWTNAMACKQNVRTNRMKYKHKQLSVMEVVCGGKKNETIIINKRKFFHSRKSKTAKTNCQIYQYFAGWRKKSVIWLQTGFIFFYSQCLALMLNSSILYALFSAKGGLYLSLPKLWHSMFTTIFPFDA